MPARSTAGATRVSAAALERQRALEQQRLGGLPGRQERQRDLRDVVLLAPQARPERRVHEGFDVRDARQCRLRFGAPRPGRGLVVREVLVDSRRDDAGGRVEPP